MERFKLSPIEGLTIVLGIAVMFILGTNVSKFNDIKKLENELKTKKQEIEIINNENKEVEKLTLEQNKKNNTEKIDRESKMFLDNMFIWKTWQEYTYNMTNIASEFPLIGDNEKFDSEGMNVGSGDSPKSSYNIKKILAGNQAETTGYIINQRLITSEGVLTRDWYIQLQLNDSLLQMNDIFMLQEVRTIN